MSRRLVGAALVAVLAGGIAALAHAVLGPQPEEQARRDGCTRSRSDQIARRSTNWAYVNDADYPASGPSPPPKWVYGVAVSGRTPALDAHVSGGDDPTSHNAFDFNLNVLPDPVYADLLGGNPETATGNFSREEEAPGRLHSERELTALPMFVWPGPGARVAAYGSWVWDCGHLDPLEHTELHPYRALWAQRVPSARSASGESEGDLYVSTDATPAGQAAECAHRTKGDAGDYLACTRSQPNWLDVSGTYDLTLPAPPRPAGATRLVARVVNRGSMIPVQRPVVTGNAARLHFTLHATPGKRLVLAQQVFLGWRPSATPVHLRVTFTRLLTRRAMDGRSALQSRRDQQVTRAPGEWLVYTNVAGIWRRWPGVIRARDGVSFTVRQTQDVFVAPGRSFRVLVAPHECDFGILTWSSPTKAMAPCPKSREFGDPSGDDSPGVVIARFRSPAAAIGTHAYDASTSAPSTCPARNVHGCYRVTFTVTRIG